MGSGVLQRVPSGRRNVTVRAAGGLLLRTGRRGRLEIAVVHRPDRDDWSLPKGKLDKGESFEDCALREVSEETGYGCVLGSFVGTTEYIDGKGRPKVVAYWLMEPADGTDFTDEPAPETGEVDEVQWIELSAAARLLTYPHDRSLLSGLPKSALAQIG